MALFGAGAICIWNDITDEMRADFYAWHIGEHIPERVGIPGFRRGRRYVAAVEGAKPEFFTLYEVDGPHILTGQDYRARLDDPTPGTRRVTSGFRGTSRALTRVAASLGTGEGGALATLRFVPSSGTEPAPGQALVERILLSMMAMARMNGAHLCVTDLEASARKSVESRGRDDIGEAPASVVLAEGCDLEAVTDAAQACAQALADHGLRSVVNLYRLEYALLADDPKTHVPAKVA